MYISGFNWSGKLTTARYYTPLGRSIQAKGITPDIVVSAMKPKGNEPKKDKEIREKDLENHFETPGKEPAKGQKKELLPVTKPDEMGKNDYQLSRALDLLKGVDLMSQLKLGK